MAISTPYLLVILAAVESIPFIYFLPHRLPANPLVYTLTRALILNVTLYAVWRIWIYPSFQSPFRHLPGPKGGPPIIGYFHAAFERPPATKFLQWMKEIPNDGWLRFRELPTREVLLVTGPKVLSEVLVAKSYHFEKEPRGRSFLRKVLGDGLVITEGDLHRFQRKNTMPVFSFRHIKDLYPMMWTKAVGLVDRVRSEGGEQATQILDLDKWSTKATMDTIGVAALGREFNTLNHSDDPLINNYEEILDPSPEKVAYFALNVLLGPRLVAWLPLKLNKTLDLRCRNIRIICRELVQSKKEAMEKRGDEHLDILSSLIKSNNFSDEELVDQMLTFIAAGHETTSSAFTWTCYLLALHRDVQSRLRQELKDAGINAVPNVGDSNLAATLESLPLLNGVCNETLRLYPTVPATLRVCMKDTTIQGLPMPKGTRLVFSMWATNRSPHLWGEDSEKYTPERWIDAETGKPNNHGGAQSNYSLLTFLHGPRSCIGQGFAKAELRCLVTAFVSEFEFEMENPNEIVIPSGAITIRPKNGLKLRLNKVQTES